MDNLTHTLIGVGMARSGLSDRFGRGTTLLLAVTSNITDIDVLIPVLTGEPSFFVRRMFTHSMFALPVLALGIAAVVRPFLKHMSFNVIFGLSLLGMAMHVFFDLLNSYGVVLLWPFSRQRFELAWVFIIDLVIWFLLLAPVLLTRVFKKHWSEQSMFRGFMGALGCYVLFCGLARTRCEHLVETWMQKNQAHPSFVYTFPEAFGGHRFRTVLREDTAYAVLLSNALTGRTKYVSIVPTKDADLSAVNCAQNEYVKKLLWFAKAPVWQRDPDTGQWQLYDLRFRSALLGRKVPFVVTLKECDFS